MLGALACEVGDIILCNVPKRYAKDATDLYEAVEAKLTEQ